jgi:hypothetical protein
MEINPSGGKKPPQQHKLSQPPQVSHNLQAQQQRQQQMQQRQPSNSTNKRKADSDHSVGGETISEQPKPAKRVKSSDWNFAVDYNDHFETPLVAYVDLKPALIEIASQLNKPVEELRIYDPYWCQGNMVQRLNDIGFKHVININRDFYKDIQQKKIPGP